MSSGQPPTAIPPITAAHRWSDHWLSLNQQQAMLLYTLSCKERYYYGKMTICQQDKPYRLRFVIRVKGFYI